MNDEPATKQDIQDLKHDVQGVKQDVQAIQHEVQVIQHDMQEVKHEMQEIKHEMREMETRIVDHLTEFTRDMETRLLTAFHGYGRGQTARMHAVEIGQSDMLLRMSALEERVLNLETHRGPGAN